MLTESLHGGEGLGFWIRKGKMAPNWRANAGELPYDSTKFLQNSVQ